MLKLLFLCLSLTALTATADTLTGDWAGYRTKLTENGVDVALTYKGEFSKPTKRGVQKKNFLFRKPGSEINFRRRKTFVSKRHNFFYLWLRFSRI